MRIPRKLKKKRKASILKKFPNARILYYGPKETSYFVPGFKLYGGTDQRNNSYL